MKSAKVLILICFTFYASSQSYPQDTRFNWQGHVVSEDGKPIEFAHIQINAKGKYYLFMSDENGYVDIKYSNASASDSILISCIGFGTRRMLASSLITSHTITLTKTHYTIGEVVVKPQKCKVKTIGNKKRKPIGHSHIGYNSVYALHIVDPKVKGKIEAVKVYMHDMYDKTWKYRPFRLRLFEGDKIFEKELVHEEIIASLPSDGKNWVTVNLSQFNIDIPDNGITVAVEALSADYYLQHGYIESIISDDFLVNSFAIGWTVDLFNNSLVSYSFRARGSSLPREEKLKTNNYMFQILVKTCK
jgi:hypothetical protein